jgi:hypothetical protein
MAARGRDGHTKREARPRSSLKVLTRPVTLGVALWRPSRPYGIATPAMERDRKPGRGKAHAGKAEGAGGSTRRFERPRGGPARPIADLMPEVGRTAFRRFGFVQSSVVSRWPEIVGQAHAQVSLPQAIRFPPGEKADGILELLVEPAHAPLIQHVVPEIIERVNRFFGYRAIARVKIRQGAVRPASAPPKVPAPPSLKPVPIELGDSLRDIGDPELRAVLESLARSIARRENDGREEE